VIPNHRGNFIFNHLKESSGQLQGLGKRWQYNLITTK
jgi:hypothetical protein